MEKAAQRRRWPAQLPEGVLTWSFQATSQSLILQPRVFSSLGDQEKAVMLFILLLLCAQTNNTSTANEGATFKA